MADVILCKVKVRLSSIRFFLSYVFSFITKVGGHSWIEVFVDGRSSCEFNFNEKGFMHMDAVAENHDVWKDPADYPASDKYRRFTPIQSQFYRVFVSLANRTLRRNRE